MVVLPEKFTILISWCPICIPLIILLALIKMVSTSSALLYNKMESRHPWRTHVRVKGSDRRPFILVLDSILVYATCVIQLVYAICEWTCLHIRTYAKQKKIKSTLRILQKIFIQFIWLINYVTKSRKSVYNKV